MSDVLCPMSGDFGLGLGQDGLGLYRVKKVADVLETLHGVGCYDDGKERIILAHDFPL